MDYPKDELFEKLAEIEHQRWADWQKYYHSKCVPEKIWDEGRCTFYYPGNMVIPGDVFERAERQINTEYKDLTEKEKNSDRDQVMRYWSLIK